jgi:DEAD/DEAH box helicase domain-containing protein
MLFEVFFDIETKKLFHEVENEDAAKLGVSIVSVYQRNIDENFNETYGSMASYWEKDFTDLWEVFQKADRIIGFNTINFDVPVLTPYATFPLAKLNHFDIMAEFKKVAGNRISLNTLVRDTLGEQKIDIGINAVKYWKKGDAESLALLQKYCESDVLLTKKLYDYGFKNKKLKYKDKWNTLREINVDFSYPEKEKQIDQIGLF